MTPLLIFLIKLVEYLIETCRISAIARSQRLLAAGCAFIEVLIWAMVFKMAFLTAEVYSLAFVFNIIAYSGGSAIGTYLAMSYRSLEK